MKLPVIVFLIFILLVMFCLLVILRVRNIKAQYALKQKNEADELLQLRNECFKLTALVNTQKKLLQDIHNLERNNLTIVSSLLEMQSDVISNSKAQRIIQDSVARIKSIALIYHQIYYLGNGHTTINFRKFAESLFMQNHLLFEEYNRNMTLQNNIEHIELSMDTVMPLGLILNEFISNSLKYSFKGLNDGVIIISLTKSHSGNYELIYKDTGNAFSGLSVNPERQIVKGVGLKLAERLVTQLKGRIVLHVSGGSLVYSIKFKPK